MTEPSTQTVTNPMLVMTGLPLYDQVEPAHVVPAVDHVIAEVTAQFEALEQGHSATWKGLLEPLEEIERKLQRVQGVVSHLNGVKNSPELRDAYQEILPKLVQTGLRMQQSEAIFHSLKQIRDAETWSSLSGVRQRIVEQKLLDAELCGIGLPVAQRERFNQLSSELSQLATTFSNHVLDATKAFSMVLTETSEIDGIPETFLGQYAQAYNQKNPEAETAATAEHGPWLVTLDHPSMTPFLQHAKHRELREKIYRARITLASEGELDNTPLIKKILELRKEKATLLGFPHFAALSLAQKMADDVDAVEDLLHELREASQKVAHEEKDELEAFAADAGAPLPLEPWDLGFWAERLREKKFDITDAELRPYFPMPRVLEGLFSLVHRLFGVSVEPADGEAPIWNKDVSYFKIKDEQGAQIAAFYLDPYSRPANKRGGAWMADCLNRCLIDGTLQLPVAHLVCNSTPPVGDQPSLMSFREVETLFHEFGHGLQHMLTKIDELDASGINGVEWDAVELPSQFMENWCYHKPTVIGMTAHFETGEALPDVLFEKLKAARTYRAANGMLRQIRFGLVDMALHSRFDLQGEQSVFDLDREIASETLVRSLLPEDRFLCAFAHIFAGGYSAGYYSYKWAEVLSADAFAAFEEAGLDDEEAVQRTGRRFRDTVLALGGGDHPMDVFKAFREREPSPEALLRHSGLLRAA